MTYNVDETPVPPVMSLSRLPEGTMKRYYEHVVRWEGMLVQRWTALYLARLDDPSRLSEVADLKPVDSDDYMSVEFALDALYYAREAYPIPDKAYARSAF